MKYPAITSLLDKADEFPDAAGRIGFEMSRDGLVELLGEVSPLLTVGVIPQRLGEGVTSFQIMTYLTFDRAELVE